MKQEIFNSIYKNAKDEIIDNYDYSSSENFYQLIVHFFCGEIYYKKWGKLPEVEKNYLFEFVKIIKSKSLNFAQFNELLLMVEQDRISEDFFNFLWGKEISKKNFLNGIKKFRVISLLCFGNFRFAYEELSKSTNEEIENKLKPFWSDLKKDYYINRPEKVIDISHIEKHNSQYIGQITGQKIGKEGKYLIENFGTLSEMFTSEELENLKIMYKEQGEIILNIQKEALNNTNIYLTWDYVDVYVATSMRNSWEYEDTYDLIENVLKSKKLRKLKLRFFDPTQSLCPGRINKGIVEGLMLKRANCTIYMVQESDTLGKDSELAATLAQGKPVIAFIPKIDVNEHSQKLQNLSINYLENRILNLTQERIFTDSNNKDTFENIDKNYINLIDNFIKLIRKNKKYSLFSLWKKEDEELKKEIEGFSILCKIIATAERLNFEKKASVLTDYHPLSLQLNLNSGVANGLLVVRNYNDCSDLLYNFLTNNLKFSVKKVQVEDSEKIKDMKEEEKYVTILEESISKCPFRVITNYEKLSNSFWNFYLNSSE